MARQEWQRACDDAKRREGWSVVGPNRLVKVVPLLPAGQGRRYEPPASGMGGYITIARSIRAKTPDAIEKALGLPPRSLASGAVVYNFARLPLSHEVEYELTADHPDGLYPTFLSSPDYPPGSAKVHQWQIKQGVQIPVALGTEVRLLPGQRFPG